MDGPIEPIKPGRSRLPSFVRTDLAAPGARPAPAPSKQVIGSADSLPQDTFEMQDLESEFPSLDVITQRILDAMHQALEAAAEEAARKAETALQHQPQTDSENTTETTATGQNANTFTPPGTRTDGKSNPVAEHLLAAAERIKRRDIGEALLGEAKAALSQAGHGDLTHVHQLKSPARLFAN